MSIAVPPNTIIADYPFNDADADIVLRSSDGIEFRCHIYLLRLASSVMKEMLSMPQGPNEEVDAKGRPVVVMPEDSATLKRMMSWCDPRGNPEMNTFDDVRTISGIMDKYDMHIVERMTNALGDARFVEKDPVRVYAIAVRYKVERVARLAATQSLRLTLDERPNVEELRYITGRDLQNLSDYHFACGKAARSVIMGHIPFNASGKPRSYLCQWWQDYKQIAAAELAKRPHSSTLLEPRCDGPLGTATPCTPKCSECFRTYGDLKRFHKILATEVEKALTQVHLVLEF